MSSKKASLILSAALLSATIILTVVAVIMAGEKPSITGAAVYQPNIPSYCYNNVDACINLDEDSDIDADDESVFAQLLDGTITNASLIHLADFDNDTNVTNAIDFQKCFVPLMNYYQDIYDGEADCNLPQGMFTEPNLSNCLQGCPDLDGDGYVDNDDYDLFHSLIGNETEYTNYPTADMTGDGFIGAEDKSCMSLFIGRIVTCNLPTYFKHTSNCPDLTDEFDVGNDGYVDANDLALFNTYSNDNNLKADFNGDGSVNEADRVIFNKYYGRIVDCDIYHAPWHVGGMHHQNIKEESTYALFGGAYNLSQSFVANCMHDDECMLTKVRLHLKNISGNPSDIVVKVYDSNTSEGPNQTYVIATTSITPSFEFNISRWVTIPFNDPPTLDKNKMYHLVVSSPNSDNQSYAWYYNDVAEQNVSTAGASWHGESDSDYAGKSVASGDINNDGYDDIIIGASNEDTGGSDGGAVYIVFGPEYSAPDNLSNADVKIFSESAHDWLGYSLATGDINNDGYDDIITGSYREDTGGLNAGAAYVVYGPISSGTYNISNVYGAKWYGESSDDVTGASVAAGDVNNDGYDDIIIGGAYGSMGALPGTVYVIYGPDYSTNNLSYADVKIYGESNGDFFSASLAVGDIDNDGYDDLIMGAYGDNTGGVNAGAAYVVSGQISSGTYNISSAYAAKWYGESSDDWAGDSVAAGDVNNDGYDDIVIGAYGAEKVYLVYGPSTGSKQLDSADAIFTGGDKLGRSVLIADIDNDGFDDIIASAPYYDISTEEGAVYVVYGPVESGTEASIEEVWGTKWYGEQNNELIGFSNNELAAGDIDDDGYNDLLVGANLYDEGSANEAGKAYLFYSPPSININGS